MSRTGSLTARRFTLARSSNLSGFALFVFGSAKGGEFFNSQSKEQYHDAAKRYAVQVITEIKAHALGIRHHLPDCTTIVDVGGQDSKVITLNAQGKVANFQMNDKCAAGTGRFLEIMAASLAYPLTEFGQAALGAEQEVQISSMCTVFAESEVISLKNRGVPREQIARTVHSSVVTRLVAMLSRTGYGEAVAFSGGVANNPCMVRMLQERLGDTQVLVPEFPDITGAFGAALSAIENKKLF